MDLDVTPNVGIFSYVHRDTENLLNLIIVI